MSPGERCRLGSYGPWASGVSLFEREKRENINPSRATNMVNDN